MLVLLFRDLVLWLIETEQVKAFRPLRNESGSIRESPVSAPATFKRLLRGCTRFRYVESRLSRDEVSQADPGNDIYGAGRVRLNFVPQAIDIHFQQIRRA